MESQPKWLYVIILLILAVLIAGYLYWQSAKKTEELTPAPKASEPAVSGTLPAINTQTNVNVPEINPVDKANPFKNVYTNPFQ